MAEESALLLWQKIKPSPEVSDVDESLRCEIYDPLWMLGRQWQMGEFKAEDAGTAAFAAVQMATVQPQQVLGFNDKKASPYNIAQQPLNMIVESIPLPFTLNIRIESAKQLKLMLSAGGKINAWKKLLSLTTLHFQLPVQTYNTENENLLNSGNENFEILLASLTGGRAIDGFLLYKMLLAKKLSLIAGASDTKTDEIGSAWKLWLEEITGISRKTNAWDRSRLEYSASVGINGLTNGNASLQLPEYHGQLMNGYSWQEQPVPDLLKNNTPAKRFVQQQNLMPVNVSFPGMPSARWWAFEDSTIDFTNLKTDNTDLGLLLLAEFGLIYSNDWLIVPFSLETGNLAKIQRLDVTDVFGVQTSVGPVKQDAFWEMFRIVSGKSSITEGSVFLPSMADHIIESEKREDVLLFRDEMSNLVWAIERTIPDGTGESIDGEEASRKLEEYLRVLAGDDPVAETTRNTETDYQYQIANTVPPNWIPFIPVRTNPADPEIVFRRGALPRFSRSKGATRIRPRTEILRSNGLYDIREEEIPMAGINVSQSIRRTRWIDGSVITWMARQKNTGRQTISGGLRFDNMI